MSRVAAVALMAGALGACSSDVARFSDNPFGNPFRSGSGSATPIDRNATGSIGRSAASVDKRVASTAPAIGTVSSQPLAAPNVTGSIPSRASLTSRAPSAVDLASATPASAVAGSAAGWSAAGGTPVVVATGETANTLSARYGVPASAILAANGLSSGSSLTPGSRITIPVYNASGSPRAAAPAVTVPAPAPVAAVTPRPTVTAPPPVAPARPQMTQRSEPVRTSQPTQPQPVQRPSDVARVVPPAPVGSPRSVASAASDNAREKARAQAEAARARAEVSRKQTATAATTAADQAKSSKVAEAKARTDAEKARVAELKAKTDADRTKAAEARKAAETERAKAAEARAKADRELRTARAEAEAAERKAKQQAAAASRTPDPAPTSSVAKDEPKATAAPTSTADFRWPARGRVINGFSGKGGNEGINIAVPEGTPVKAAGDGVVAYSGNELKGYGNLVLIRHDNGYVSAYAHNGDVNVRRGEKVSRGQVIAKSGQSGNVASPQLHFEIRKGSTPVDPMTYLNN
jgi:murein DD-endopeptidase MepM/ murein hydrolase activator NlpD